MSALGSSVINKSGKKFAPKKAPARRPAGPDSTQGSTRPSVDRQTRSQTPQPQYVVNHVASTPAPSLSLPTLVSTQEPTQSVQTRPSRDSVAVRIPIPSGNAVIPKRSSPSAIIPQKRPLEVHTGSPPLASSSEPVPIHAAPNLAPTGASPNSVGTDTCAETQPSNVVLAEGIAASDQVNNIQARESAAPLTKSQMIRRLQAGADASDGSAVGPNVPFPSTETDNATTEVVATQDKTAQPKKRTRRKPRNTTGPSVDSRVVGVSGRPTDQSDQSVRESALGSLGETESQYAQSQSYLDQTKHRRSRKQALQEAAAEIVEDAMQGAAKNSKKRGRKSKRAKTPEDAENIRIAPSETRMMELCRDGRIGRKSIREQELREMDRAAFVKRKQGELQEMMGQADSPNQNGAAESSSARVHPGARQSEREEVALNVPNTIIVNGQIQIDEESLQIDRHAAAAAQRNIEELEPIDENDLSRKVTSGSWLKRDKSGGWNEILLDRFYQGLRMFGTDFEMISKMFPGKTRHAIKRKFCREEKIDYPRIKTALMEEKVPVVLEEYEKMTGTQYEDPKDLEKVMEEDRKKLEEEQAVEKQGMEDAIREREAQAAAEREAAREDSGNDNHQKRRKRKSDKKGKGKQREPRPRKKQLGLGGWSRGADETSQTQISAAA
ncbi:MAG: hypothetical protein Q9217_006144 [Psora testacea]